MDPAPNNSPQQASRTVDTAATETQILLAEYAALRTEIERRTTLQWNVVALQITSAGAVAGLVISNVSNLALLLIVPLSSYMLGRRYILHDRQIELVHAYIAGQLSKRLAVRFGWEGFRKGFFKSVSLKRGLTVIRWDFTHPTRLAFEGIAVLALATAASVGIYRWSPSTPVLVVVGFAVAWVLGVVVTYTLDRSFATDQAIKP